jgi:uncharacterized protein (DUF433 family)
MVTHPKTFTRISRTPGVVGGEPVIAGTRTPVRTIVQYARIYQDNPAMLETVYPHLTRADIDEALAYYEAHRAEIDRYIAKNEDDEDDEDA